jgi:hypothetical protein
MGAVLFVFPPNGTIQPAPVFLLHSFASTRDTGHETDPDRPGILRNGIPLGGFLLAVP